MKMKQEIHRYARKVKGKLTTIFDPESLETLARHSKFIQRSIDLQKMNWKFRAGFQEHTGVSLKEHLPNNPRGEYTRVHQDTAQSRHRQRPPQPSAACLSAR